MSSRKQTVFLIIFVSVLLLLLSAAAILPRFLNRAASVPFGTTGNTAGNSYNDGLFCEYDGVVYFSNPYDGGALYSMNPDESGVHKLSAVSVSHLNAGGSYLFYFQSRASGSAGLGYVRSRHGVYRSDLNGRKSVCLFDDVIFNMQLAGNALYLLSSAEDGPHFYQVPVQGGEPEELFARNVDFSCAMSDGTIYYVDGENGHNLCRYDTSTGTSTQVWEGSIWYPVYENGYIYYLDVSADYRLCRYSLSEDAVEILTHDRVDCYNLAGGYIYYQRNSAASPALIRMGTDGQDPETVAEGNFTHINVTSRYVYFTPWGTDTPMYRTAIGATDPLPFDAAKEAIP